MHAPLRQLGRTELNVSAIGLGTVKLGRTAGLKHPGSWSLPTDDQALSLLRAARELGVNLIDTAPAYGQSEERLGTLLTKVASRESWVISTKVGEEFNPVTAESRYDFSPESVWKSVERSLKRLNTSFLDCVLIHSDGRDLEIIHNLGTLEALADLKVSGHIRSYGISTKTPEGGRLAVERCDVVMLTLNPRDRDDLPAIAAASQNGCGVLIKKALLSGHTADAAGFLRDMPDLARLPTAQACARFAARTHGVSSVIIGTLSADHLREAVEAAR